MPRYEFEETCTSRPTYEVEAENIAAAIERYGRGGLDPRSEEVEENFLVDVRCDGESIIPAAESLGIKVQCESCESAGDFCCGVPGVLARVRNGRLEPGTSVERCDACRRYESDEAAFERLVELGIASAQGR